MFDSLGQVAEFSSPGVDDLPLTGPERGLVAVGVSWPRHPDRRKIKIKIPSCYVILAPFFIGNVFKLSPEPIHVFQFINTTQIINSYVGLKYKIWYWCMERFDLGNNRLCFVSILATMAC